MKKLNLLIMQLLLVFTSFQIASAQTKEIQMMYFSSPPLIIIDEKTGAVSGAVYDLIENYIAKNMNVKFIWGKSATPVPRQVSTLESQSGYASAILVYTPDRVNVVSYTEKQYVETKSVLAVLKSNKLNRINVVDDIINFKIGYGQGNYISPFMKDTRIKLDLIGGADYTKSNFMKLTSNRIDAIYLPNHMHMLYEIRQAKLEGKVKILELPEKKALTYIAFSKNDKDVVAKYNNAFNNVDGTNLMKKLLGKYIDTSNL